MSDIGRGNGVRQQIRTDLLKLFDQLSHLLTLFHVGGFVVDIVAGNTVPLCGIPDSTGKIIFIMEVLF